MGDVGKREAKAVADAGSFLFAIADSPLCTTTLKQCLSARCRKRQGPTCVGHREAAHKLLRLQLHRGVGRGSDLEVQLQVCTGGRGRVRAGKVTVAQRGDGTALRRARLRLALHAPQLPCMFQSLPNIEMHSQQHCRRSRPPAHLSWSRPQPPPRAGPGWPGL